MAATNDKITLVPEVQESSSYENQTDSYGSKSDNSGKSITITTQNPFGARQRMEIVCVIDLHSSSHLNERKKAFEEAKLACAQINTDLVQHIQVLFSPIRILLLSKNHCWLWFFFLFCALKSPACGFSVCTV